METAADELAILDSHTHAWARWPYEPPVPDEESRGTIQQLVHELDVHGVEQALVVCAAIEKNPDNVEYVAAARDRDPGRLRLVADLDCHWSTTYHVPGSAGRLQALDDRYGLTGFTHYLADDNDGWLLTDEADAVFRLAAERGLIVSLGATPAWQRDLRALARRYPSVPILCHALGVVRMGVGLSDVLASSDQSNIYVKVAGFAYCAERDWDYPWPDVTAALERLHGAYGAGRLCWGSDYPASTRYCTYRQSLEVVRTHCPFLSADDLRLVLGETLRSLLPA